MTCVNHEPAVSNTDFNMKNLSRSLMNRAILLTSLGFLLSLPSLAPAADGPVSEKALQGVWRGVRFGSGKGEDPAKGVKLELTIKDSHISCKRLPDGEAVGEGDFKLSDGGKTIDALGSTGSYKGKNYHGILKIEGDTLIWCTSSTGKEENRPSEFVADQAKKNWLVIVKRETGKN